jgi:hypothetical protein
MNVRTTAGAIARKHLGNILAFAGEVREAVRLADTKRPGWRPVGSPRSVRRIIRALAGQLSSAIRAVVGKHLTQHR